jgi:hypothetical protein
MAKRPIRYRKLCPGCGYPHVIRQRPSTGLAAPEWEITGHSAPGGGLCQGSYSKAPAPAVPAKGPGPNTEGKVTVSGGIEFIPWPKIARLANETMVITEKIDGTNACVQFRPNPAASILSDGAYELEKPYIMAAQSRTRIITPTSDNYGFAAWAYEHQESLFADLGYGVHFGEWWGAGIQRRYGMDRKVFSLFNTHRWDAKRGQFATPNLDVVPLLYTGPVDVAVAQRWYDGLREGGSEAADFDNPEGIVVYLTATGVSWKLTDAKVQGKGPRDEHQNALGGI